MHRYVLTGTPGAGKTSILRGLAKRGCAVVEEAATDVVSRGMIDGEAQPWTRASFIDEIVAEQRLRQVAGAPPGEVQIFDRSPVCTHALAVFLGLPITRSLAEELDRITAERVYQRQVFFVRNLGFCEPTTARRISFQDALKFERIHEDSYRTFGYELIDIPADRLDRRIAAVHETVSRIARPLVARPGGGQVGRAR
jgi:predicted ATPase